MRISTTQFYQTGLYAIGAQQTDLMHIYQQLGSGKRILAPSDDPLAAAQAINISQSQALNQRYAENRAVAMRSLGQEENTLYSVTNLLQDVKTRLIEAGNGTLSDQDRATLADVLANARESLLNLANATDGNGQYLFSGSRGNVAPFQDSGSGITYQGDLAQRNIQADQTSLIAGGDTGADVFKRAAPGTRSYLTSADPGNAGTGLLGKPDITDPDLASAGTAYTLTITGSGTYQVQYLDDEGTLVAETGSYTAGRDNILALPGGVQVQLSGEPENGDSFQITPTYGDQAGSFNIFNTLDQLVQSLASPIGADDAAQAGFRNMLAGAIQRIDIHYDNVLTVRASVGARMTTLEAMDANGDQRGLDYSTHLSELEDLDYYTASTQLQLRLSALQAASLAFQKIQSTNLFSLGSE
ncbi:flagellar hook-associated protein 3 [Allopusillimonas soli]|uniref:Flagellar hook-associated protein FlgL n=1 Tax=Allopusillimonas soli TaxID=659016 RepID=A0A853F6Q3_9BURK|nr:flagellar hook-associated protein FlgL [Allopusillimonas soli]NYT35518.1 flagellar hook-associated protein FlgL [Allopusillimonas soli]TEA75925.1 flagellar hook-associated protein 3 [Allopusillimonas soli]